MVPRGTWWVRCEGRDPLALPSEEMAGPGQVGVNPVREGSLGVGSQIFSDPDLEPRTLPFFWALGAWAPRSRAGPECHLLCILKLWPLAPPPTPHIFPCFGNSLQSAAITFYDFQVHPWLISALSPRGSPMKLTERTPFSRSCAGVWEVVGKGMW